MFSYEQHSLARGDSGTEQTLAHMRRLVLRETALPIVRTLAAQLAANTPGHAPEQIAQHIRRYVQARWRFVRDPLDKELLHTPEAMLNMLNTQGYIAADCDDAAILCAALGVSVGLRARFVAVGFLDESAPYAHVWTELAPPTGTGAWVECDVTRSMQTLPTHLLSRFIIFPVIDNNMRLMRGTTSGREGFRPATLQRGRAHASPFAALGAYDDVGYGLSGTAIADAMNMGLSGPTWMEQVATLEAKLPTVTNKLARRVIEESIKELKKKIEAKRRSLAPYLPAQPPPVAAPAAAPAPVAPPSPTDVPAAPVQPIIVREPVFMPAPQTFAPTQSFPPQPLPVVMDTGDEQPSSGEAGSGASGGGLLSSPAVLFGVGVFALALLMRRPR